MIDMGMREDSTPVGLLFLQELWEFREELESARLRKIIEDNVEKVSDSCQNRLEDKKATK